jgi:diguanylate cyclase (GGDEF)-like protein
VLGAIALGVTYAGIYKLIVVGSSFGASVGATFWPASGLTVSVLVLRSRREWPAFLTAVWIADFLMDLHGGGGYSLPVSLGIASANVAEPLLSASLLRRWIGAPPDLSTTRGLGLFYIAAVGCGPLLSATIASGWQWILGTNAVWPYLGRWWVGDGLGVVVIAPVILTIAANRARPKPSEVAVGCALVAVAGLLLAAPVSAREGLPFLLIPALALIAIRIGTRAAAVAVGLIGVVVEVLTVVGDGPFAGHGAFTGLLSAQMYLVACSVSGLTAAALMAGLISRERLALHDSLTGLANRRLLMDRTSRSLTGLERSRGSLGLVYIDLDDFKAINDAHGHVVGDQVLVEFARRLESVAPEPDTIARIGGDEFVILVDRLVEPAAISALADSVERVAAEPIEHGDITVRVGASVGYAICDRHDERPEDVLSRADRAMYGTKRARTEPDALAAQG